MQSGSSGSGGHLVPGEVDVRSDINVTPLVDVCLVLLIIFMVVTPMLQRGEAVALPETRKPEKIPESTRQLDMAIKLDGNVFVGPEWVPQEQLLQRLTDIYNQENDKVVVLKADRRLKYKEVRRVMEVINKAGFSGVGLITLKKEQSKG